MMLLYIDPGTGSMLFTILLSVVGALFFTFRMLLVRIRFVLSGGHKEARDDSHMPLVIFTDSKRYWNTFEPICRELDKRGQETWYMTASPNDPALTTPFEHIHAEFIGEGNRAFARLNFLHADVVLSTTPGIEVYQWKRSRDVRYYVHIPHAASDITLYRMFGIDYYDAILLSGEYQKGQIRRLEALRDLPAKELEIVGIPYMDEMLRRLERDGMDAASADTVATNQSQRTILLAPSWGPSAILSRYGTRMIEALLATGYHIIVRPHPQSRTSEKEMLDALMQQFPESTQLEWNQDNDNYDVLRRSDIMISDFSGVIWDFTLVYDKPVIYADTTFDKGVYDCYWLDEDLWTFKTLPRVGRQLVAADLEYLKERIDACLADESLAQGREQARKETWENIGHGAEAVAEYLVRKVAQVQAGEVDDSVQAQKSALGIENDICRDNI